MVKSITKYVALDGKEFEDYRSAEQHERLTEIAIDDVAALFNCYDGEVILDGWVFEDADQISTSEDWVIPVGTGLATFLARNLSKINEVFGPR